MVLFGADRLLCFPRQSKEDQQPVTSYPHTAGFKTERPETSVAAARNTDAAALRERCYAALVGNPSTADEVAARIGESILAVRPRISELRAMRRIALTTERRKNTSGHSAAVWRVVRTDLFET